MSRQNKQARKANIAKQFTAIHKGGSKGPSKTKKLTKKVRTWASLKRTGKPTPHSLYTDEDVI